MGPCRIRCRTHKYGFLRGTEIAQSPKNVIYRLCDWVLDFSPAKSSLPITKLCFQSIATQGRIRGPYVESYCENRCYFTYQNKKKMSEEGEAPAPIEEVEMSVLDALKEVCIFFHITFRFSFRRLTFLDRSSKKP